MKQTERILKALANRRRLAIIKHLKNYKQSAVGDMAAAIKLSLKATSKHLAILKAADIVESDQRSLSVFYHLVPLPAGLLKSIISYL
ncbi:TPA: transcriptional regulator [Patescibacteria group bacterium]|nr:transcriptional regulator [Patescibacteria group bacterium]HCU47768.1 transcriptional regulator [Patescibacteria group bacterium]